MRRAGSNRCRVSTAQTPTTTPTTTMPLLSPFRLFRSLDAAQTNHGVPASDYPQYAAYATKKLSRLRHNRAVRALLVHNHRYAASTAAATAAAAAAVANEGGTSGVANTTSINNNNNHRRRHAYCSRKQQQQHQPQQRQPAPSSVDDDKKDDYDTDNAAAAIVGTDGDKSEVPLVVTHENILWNLVFQAERAWAQACAMQQHGSATTGANASVSWRTTTTTTSNKAHHHAAVQRRLNKAAQHARALHRTVQAAATYQQQTTGNSASASASADTNTTNTCISSGVAIDAVTVQECDAYAAWMAGHAALEHGHYSLAHAQYDHCLSTLLALASESKTAAAATPTTITSTATHSEDVAAAVAMRDVWTNRAEALVRPLVRYCHYEAAKTTTTTAGSSSILGTSKQVPASTATIVQTVQQKQQQPAAIVLHFRGKDIALDSYKQIAVLYLKVEPLLKSLFRLQKQKEQPDGHDDDDEALLLQLLSDLDDAAQLVSSEIKPYEKSLAGNAPGPAVAAKLASLRAIQAFFRYQKLAVWRVQQERRLPALLLLLHPPAPHNQTKSTPIPTLMMSDAELVHAYDSLQQTVVAMAQLPLTDDETNNDDNGDERKKNTGGNHDDDDPYVLEAQAHVVRIRALRCYYLAKVYESSNSLLVAGSSFSTNSKHSQVGALLQQADKLAKRAVEEIAASDTMPPEEINAHLQALSNLSLSIQAMKSRVQATLFLETATILDSSSGRDTGVAGGSGTIISTQRPLWMRLDEWDGGPVLVDSPPMPIPMPCKGVFYDIAWNHVACAVPVEAMEEYIAAHETKKSRGLLSWFGGN